MNIKALPLMFSYALSLHVLWAIALLIDPVSAQWATAPHALAQIFNGYTAIILIAVSVVTLGALWKIRHSYLLVGLLMPQQFILCVSALGALNSILKGSFSDGVIRPIAFIFVDKLPAILAALMHTIAIIQVASTREK